MAAASSVISSSSSAGRVGLDRIVDRNPFGLIEGSREVFMPGTTGAKKRRSDRRMPTAAMISGPR